MNLINILASTVDILQANFDKSAKDIWLVDGHVCDLQKSY